MTHGCPCCAPSEPEPVPEAEAGSMVFRREAEEPATE